MSTKIVTYIKPKGNGDVDTSKFATRKQLENVENRLGAVDSQLAHIVDIVNNFNSNDDSTYINNIIENSKSDYILFNDYVFNIKNKIVINKPIKIEFRNTTINYVGGKTNAIIEVNSDNVVLKGSLTLDCKKKNYYDGYELYSTSCILINGDNVKIDGITVIDPCSSAINLYKSNNCVLSNNTLINGQQGIVLNDSHKNTISINNIEKSNVSSNHTTHIVGIKCLNSKLNEITNNIVSNYDMSIELFQNNDYNIVSNNKLISTGWGISLDSSKYNTIVDNIVDGEGALFFNYALELAAASNNKLINNTCLLSSTSTSGTKNGILIAKQGSDNIIKGNTFDWIDGTVINSYSGSFNKIEDNTIKGGARAISIGTCDNLFIENNHIVGCKSDGIFLDWKLSCKNIYIKKKCYEIRNLNKSVGHEDTAGNNNDNVDKKRKCRHS